MAAWNFDCRKSDDSSLGESCPQVHIPTYRHTNIYIIKKRIFKKKFSAKTDGKVAQNTEKNAEMRIMRGKKR